MSPGASSSVSNDLGLHRTVHRLLVKSLLSELRHVVKRELACQIFRLSVDKQSDLRALHLNIEVATLERFGP